MHHSLNNLRNVVAELCKSQTIPLRRYATFPPTYAPTYEKFLEECSKSGIYAYAVKRRGRTEIFIDATVIDLSMIWDIVRNNPVTSDSDAPVWRVLDSTIANLDWTSNNLGIL